MSEQDVAPASSPITGGFLFNVNLVFVTTLISNTAFFVVAILMARALGPEGRGVTALYQAAVNLGFAFLSLGVSSAAFYFLARKELTGRQSSEAGLSVTLMSALVTAIAVLITWLFFNDSLADKQIPYWLAIFSVPAVIQIRLTEALLRAQGRFGAMNAIDICLPLSMLGALGGVELLHGLTVPLAVWAWSLSFVPALILGYILMGRDLWPRGLAPLSLIIKTVKFGGQGQLSNLIQLLNYRMDVFLILIFVNTSGVGLYTVATSQTEGLWIIANSVATVLLTNITAGDAANAARMTPIVCRNTLLVTAAGAVGAAVVAPIFITIIFGSAYGDATLPYLILLPGTVALSGAKILSAYVFSRGRPMINSWIALATLLATVPADLIFIYFFGVPGAAAGASFGYCVSLILTAFAYRHLSGGSILEALVPRPSDLKLYINGLRSLLRRFRPRRPSPEQLESRP